MRLLWLCWIGFVLPAAAAGQAPPAVSDRPAQAATADAVQRLFEQLEDPEFAVREQAELRLRMLGPDGIPALESAALTRPSGTLPVILGLLERMFIEDGPDIADAAEQALERLASSENPQVVHRARAILSGNQFIRTRRAVNAIRELGGRVEFMMAEDLGRGNMIWGWGNNPQSVIPGLQQSSMHILLLRGWEGGPEGLRHLMRLEDAWSARLWRIEITNIRGSGLALEDVQSLKARIPNLSVHERGASLGIKGLDLNGECVVHTVFPDGAGAKAGLQEGDIVKQLKRVSNPQGTANGDPSAQRMGDIPIEDFSDLIGNLLNFEPGEQVVLRIERGMETIDLPVTLGGWSDLKFSNPVPVPLPMREFPAPLPRNDR